MMLVGSSEADKFSTKRRVESITVSKVILPDSLEDDLLDSGHSILLLPEFGSCGGLDLHCFPCTVRRIGDFLAST